MLGYDSYFEKSMNGVKTLSDGKTIIRNGTITTNRINSTHLTVDNMSGDAMNAYNLNILDLSNNVLISNAEFLTLNGSDSSTTIQNQLEDLKNNVEILNNILGDDLSMNIQDLGERLDTIEDDILLLQTDLNTAEENISTLDNELYTLSNKTDFYQLNIIDASNNIIISNSEFLALNDISGNIQTQINDVNNKTNFNLLNTKELNIVDVSSNVIISNSEFLTLNNITSNIQGQINTVDSKTFNFRGIYDISANYLTRDMVRYNNALYYCIVNNTTNILPSVLTNWILYLDTLQGIQGVQGPQGERGPRGPAPDDSDDGGSAFFGSLAGGVAGGIIGGVATGGVGQFLGAMTDAGFATMEAVGETLDEAYDEWEIQAIKDKVQYQSATSLSANTYFKSDVVVQDALLANKVVLKQDGKIEANELECANVNVNNDLYVADQINGAGNWSTSGNLSATGSNVVIGPATQLGSVIINGYVSMPLMNSFFGFNVVDGFIDQF